MSSADKRLLIRNIERFETLSQKADVLEFEVVVEVQATGDLHCGPFTLAPWDVAPIQYGVPRSLVLRVVDCLGASAVAGVPSKSGFYHGISMQAEFCTVASVFSRRRLTLGPLVRLQDRAFRVPVAAGQRHAALTTGALQIQRVEDGIGLLARMPGRFHEAFILACRMYQEALVLLDEKPDLAYLLLVSSMEVFVAKYAPSTKEGDLPADVRNALTAHPDESARLIIVKRLLATDRGISRNFVAFICDHVTDEFWQQSPTIAPEQGRVTKQELPELLRRIYGQRSSTLHEAVPFPPNVLDPPESNAEIDRSSEIVVGTRKWTANQFIPYVGFMERLANHVLMEFLRRKVNEATKQG